MQIKARTSSANDHKTALGHHLRQLVLLALLLVPATTVSAQSITVESITVAWEETHDLLPDVEPLKLVPVHLRRTPDGFAPSVKGEPSMRSDIESLNRMGGIRCTPAAIKVLATAIESRLELDGLLGVNVAPMQLPVEGAVFAVDVYLVAHMPLEGGVANPDLPKNLVPLSAAPEPPPPAPMSNWTIRTARASWQEGNPLLVDADSVLSVAVRLGERDGVYTSPERGRRVMVDSIRQFISDGPAQFDEAALESIGNAVSAHLHRQGFQEATVSVAVEGQDELKLNLAISASRAVPEPATEPPPVVPDPSPEPVPPGPAQETQQKQSTPATTPGVEPPARDPGEAVEQAEQVPPATPPQEEPGAVEPAPPVPEVAPIEPIPSIDGKPYIVDPFEIDYQYDHPDLPTINDYMTMPITLGYIDSEDGGRDWVAPRNDVTVIKTSLNELNEAGGGVFWSSAIATISTAISRVLIADDLLGVFVIPDQAQISSDPGTLGDDLRPAGDTELTIMITVGRVIETRTVAQGDRIEEEDQLDHESHDPIKTESPARPHDNEADLDEGKRPDLIRQTELTEYVHHLNRHPGRNVEASVAASAVPGGVSLDYLVFEPDPLTIYYEIGNTGTPQENGLRQRFGLFHSQLTGNDDTLALEYVTSNFQITNAVLGSYQFRVSEDNRIRGGVLGTWNQFVNDQFGEGLVEGFEYTGSSWSGGGQMTFNIYQDGPFFIDLVPGLNYQNVKVNNELAAGNGEAGFLLPYGQLTFSRQDDRGLLQAMIGIEGSPLSQDINELTMLGRVSPSEKWARMNWSASLSTFLEPLLDPQGWSDPDTPETSTLAHELALRFSGQYSFGSRLVPQFQSIMGGLYSVRGYAQSVVAGDNAVFGSVEYRFHLPRTFAIEPEPIEFMGGAFRASPQHIYGRPDWDLIFKGFFDAGYVSQNGSTEFEADNTLLGAGIGLEFLYKSNLRVQLDWGFALHDLKFGLAEAGSSRLYVTGTFLW